MSALFQLSFALAFDGLQQFAEVPDASSLDLAGEWTIEAWVRPAPGFPGIRHMVSKWGVLGAASYAFELNGLNLRLATTDAAGPTSVLEAVSSLAPNVWQHVAATFLAGTARLFVNGALVAEGPMLTPANSTKPLSIGREGPPLNSYYFGGALDEVRVWQVARTQQELQATMNAVLVAPQAGLVGYWRFDEATGQSINDLSGTGNNGTLGGSLSTESADPSRVSSAAPVE